jgi:hypothetical protein
LDQKGNRARSHGSGGGRRLRSLPPLDPTNPPSVARIPVARIEGSGVREVAKPILASECLKDDIAPLEPFDVVGRATYAIAGAGLSAIAVLAHSIPIGIGAVAALLAAGLPRYSFRAAAAVASAIVVATTFAPSFAFRIVAASLLAAPLFLRATYRAHRGTRIALGIGVALFVLAALGAGRISGIAIGVVAAASLLGFMNDQTTGGCAFWGGLAILVATGSIALAHAPIVVVAAALATITCASVGMYQLVAQYIAPGERERDHRLSLPPPPSNDAE